VEKAFLKGVEGKVKIDSPWRTNFGACYFTLLFLPDPKSARSVLPNPVIVWDQISLLNTFYFRCEKVA